MDKQQSFTLFLHPNKPSGLHLNKTISSPSQNYRENLLRRWVWVLVHQKFGRIPITFRTFISVWLCRWSQRKYNWSTVYTMAKDVGVYLEFLRTMSPFLMNPQNDWCRQEAPIPSQVILNLPILSRKSCWVLRNYVKQSSNQTKTDLLCQIDKPYYLWICVHESSN